MAGPPRGVAATLLLAAASFEALSVVCAAVMVAPAPAPDAPAPASAPPVPVVVPSLAAAAAAASLEKSATISSMLRFAFPAAPASADRCDSKYLMMRRHCHRWHSAFALGPGTRTVTAPAMDTLRRHPLTSESSLTIHTVGQAEGRQPRGDTGMRSEHGCSKAALATQATENTYIAQAGTGIGTKRERVRERGGREGGGGGGEGQGGREGGREVREWEGKRGREGGREGREGKERGGGREGEGRMALQPSYERVRARARTHTHTHTHTHAHARTHTRTRTHTVCSGEEHHQQLLQEEGEAEWGGGA